jgi:biopolymer transport protein ExbB/TolQ
LWFKLLFVLNFLLEGFMAHDFSLVSVIFRNGLASGLTIGLLILMSIVVFAVLYERWTFYRNNYRGRLEVLAGLEPFLNKKNYQECLEACDRNGTLLAKVVRAGLKARAEKIDITQAMEREAKVQLLRMEKRLPLLATIGSTAPFVGLFGTVLGVIEAFKDLAQANAGGAAVVSQGIAEALVATATGLFVAITAVFIYNLFQSKLNEIALEAEILISEITERFEA